MTTHGSSEVQDRVGVEGKMTFNGQDYNLHKMDAEGLKLLEIEISQDKDMLGLMLQRRDLDKAMKKDEDYSDWKISTQVKIAIRKRQISTIHAEFIRRKQQMPPLDNYAFSAIYELYGREALDIVKEKASELRDKQIELYQRSDQSIAKDIGLKRSMCDGKIRHDSKKGATGQIEQMRARKMGVDGMKAYQCPFCNGWHIGHSVNRWNR